ncbi:MAG: Hsp70 family protein [Xanthomonadales bacterium]|nr:Hsp70 family protein [Xanthomonadales bacterium]
MTATTVFDDLRDALAQEEFDGMAVGIDLGTTKSCIAVARFDAGDIVCECQTIDEPGQPEGQIAVPSVVAVKDGEAIVGHAAKRLARTSKFFQHRGSFSETKNEIGLRHTYARAPEGFQSATEIATHLVRHLMEVSGLVVEPVAEPLVITVPASFHGAQRTATLESADQAFDGCLDVRLLDEPYAAVLDLLHRDPGKAGEHLAAGATWLVFDFGGGTCDVALFTLQASETAALAPRLLATSRYHRIGGGDIDRAIVHGHLIPSLLERYRLSPTTVSYADKRRRFEPVLLPVAEQLKRALCQRLRAQSDDGNATSAVEVVSAGDHCIEWNGRELFLSDARLDQTAFEKLLRPFLDSHPDKTASDEYVERDSVFRPIHQVLARAGLLPDAIDLVVLAGSSSRIPQVQKALQGYFAEADIVELGDDFDVQGAIARGAALQALAIAATGKPLIAPASSAELGLRTRQGLVPLVKAGAALPVAADHAVRVYAPATVDDRSMDLAIEVIADGGRVVGSSIWQLEAPVVQGEPLDVHWALDENQCLTLRLRRAQSDDEGDNDFEQRFDAPLTHTDQGHVARCRLLEAEELVRCGSVPDCQLGRTFEQMARDAARMGQRERALHYVSCAVQRDGPTLGLLNLRAIYLDELGDFAHAEAVYRQAAEWPTAGFNLALFLHRNKRHQEALEVIDPVLAREPQPAYLVLKGDIVAALGQQATGRLIHQDAISRVIDPTKQSVWSLGWLARCARTLGHDDLARKFREASTAQIEAEEDSVLQGALLPERGDVAGEMRAAA